MDVGSGGSELRQASTDSLTVATYLGMNRITLIAEGVLDRSSAPLLMREVRVALRRESAVHVDLARVDFVDSEGVDALIRLRRSAQTSGETLELANPSDRVMRVVDLIGAADELGLESRGDGSP